ncbi:MAG: hypothetical protein AAGF57_04570 [Pseudomonadota bacterium]
MRDAKVQSAMRQVTEKDLVSLSDVYVRAFAADPWQETWKQAWAHDRLSIIFASPGFYGLVSETDDTLLGAAMGRSLPHKGFFEYELLELWVRGNIGV